MGRTVGWVGCMVAPFRTLRANPLWAPFPRKEPLPGVSIFFWPIHGHPVWTPPDRHDPSMVRILWR